MNQLNQLLRLPDVRQVTGLSKSSIYRLESEGAFPQRVRLSERATAWKSDEIAAWIESRPIAPAYKGEGQQ